MTNHGATKPCRLNHSIWNQGLTGNTTEGGDLPTNGNASMRGRVACEQVEGRRRASRCRRGSQQPGKAQGRRAGEGRGTQAGPGAQGPAEGKGWNMCGEHLRGSLISTATVAPACGIPHLKFPRCTHSRNPNTTPAPHHLPRELVVWHAVVFDAEG